MDELLSAIKKMKGKKAAGPDNIPPSFLKSLGPLALQELLSIFKSSFALTHCPHIWRVATIIPLQKAGKSCDVASFYPISLKSCVQTSGMHSCQPSLLYSQNQPHLCSVNSKLVFVKDICEDQITQIVQAIEDGFQQCSMQHSILTHLDYRKAYNMVWREKLLLHMLDAGIPSTFIHWIRSFFNNCRARVQLFNAFSSS